MSKLQFVRISGGTGCTGTQSGAAFSQAEAAPGCLGQEAEKCQRPVSIGDIASGPSAGAVWTIEFTEFYALHRVSDYCIYSGKSSLLLLRWPFHCYFRTDQVSLEISCATLCVSPRDSSTRPAAAESPSASALAS